MKTEELLATLRSLSPKERKKFASLIESKYWQLSQDYKAFFLELLEKKQAARKALCEKEEKKSGRNFRSKRKKLAELTEEFIAMIMLSKDAISKKLALATFYSEKKLETNYQRKIKAVRKEIDKAPTDLYTAFHEYRRQELIATKVRAVQKSKSLVKATASMAEMLERFYRENNWRLKCELRNLELTSNKSVNLSTQKSYLAQVFELIFNMHNDETPLSAHYLSLKKRIQLPDFSKLSADVRKTVLLHLINYATRRINHGKKNFAKDYLDYLEIFINQGFLLENGYLDYPRYHNTILAYLVDDRHDMQRIDAFVKKYSPHVLQEERFHLMRQILSAYIAIFKNPKENIDEWIEELRQAGLDIVYKVILTKLEFKVAYDQDDYENMENKLRSLQRFAKKKELPSEKEESLNSFIQLATALMKRELTLEKIENHPDFLSALDKTWLSFKFDGWKGAARLYSR